MPQVESIYAKWNPWHGCTKLSAGCKYCYVYRQDAMYGTEEAASVCRKTASFDLPLCALEHVASLRQEPEQLSLL